MQVTIHVFADPSGQFRAVVPGLSLFEGLGATAEEAFLDALEWASLYLECKEPEMLHFERVDGPPPGED